MHACLVDKKNKTFAPTKTNLSIFRECIITEKNMYEAVYTTVFWLIILYILL